MTKAIKSLITKMLSLSENGIKNLVQRVLDPNGYILQVLKIQAIDNHSYR